MVRGCRAEEAVAPVAPAMNTRCTAAKAGFHAAHGRPRGKTSAAEFPPDLCPPLCRCFIGKRRLEKALRSLREAHPDLECSVRWRPFFLDPTLPKQKDKTSAYREKFGEARMKQMIPFMTKVGSEEGIKFSVSSALHRRAAPVAAHP